MTNVDTVRVATTQDSTALIELLSAAFHDDPTFEWALPDAQTRRDPCVALFTHVMGPALRSGTVEVIDGPDTVDAVAVWFDVAPDDPAGDVEAMLAALGPTWPALGIDRMRRLHTLMGSGHPRHQRHAYLAFIAVRPGTQGMGLGSRLIANRLRHLDDAGVAAYLEASSPRSCRVYVRHGFVPYGETMLPGDDCPPLFPLWRDPVSE